MNTAASDYSLTSCSVSKVFKACFTVDSESRAVGTGVVGTAMAALPFQPVTPINNNNIDHTHSTCTHTRCNGDRCKK